MRSDGSSTDPFVPPMTRRSFVGKSFGVALTIGGTGALLSACGGGGSDSVTVLSTSAYITPEILKRFKKDTGITARGVPAESDSDTFTKLKAGGGAQYDLIVANCGWCPLYFESGLTQPFALSEIKGSENLYPNFTQNKALPYIRPDGKVLLYPNMWGALGEAWNTSVAYQPSEPYSWNDLWSKEIPKGKVMLAGGGDDFIATAGLAQGVPRDQVYSMKGAQLQSAEEYLKQLMPFQWNRSVDSEFRAAIRSEKAWMGLATTLGSAPILNEEAGKEVAKVVIPKEGSLGWIDGLQLAKGTKKRKNALAYIEWFGNNQWVLDYLFDQYSNAQCNKKQVEKIIAGGGPRKARAEAVQATDPELADQLAFQRQPDDPKAWTAAYDRVLAAS